MTTFDGYIILFEYSVQDVFSNDIHAYLRHYPQQHLEENDNEYYYYLKPHIMLLNEYRHSPTYWIELKDKRVFTVPFEIPKLYKIFPEAYIIRQAKKVLKDPAIANQFLARKMK